VASREAHALRSKRDPEAGSHGKASAIPGRQPREGRTGEGRAIRAESGPWRAKPKRATRSGTV